MGRKTRNQEQNTFIVNRVREVMLRRLLPPEEYLLNAAEFRRINRSNNRLNFTQLEKKTGVQRGYLLKIYRGHAKNVSCSVAESILAALGYKVSVSVSQNKSKGKE